MVLGKLLHVKQWPNQSSYTSNHLIAKRDRRVMNIGYRMCQMHWTCRQMEFSSAIKMATNKLQC